jgi:predicted RNA binding protein YcfA (HicA-like mRNA interferase family)
MSQTAKVLEQILRGTSDRNIQFQDLLGLLLRLGFSQRVKGSHHIFSKSGISEIINIQPTNENKCKPYQVKQVRELIVKYKLSNDL